MASSGSLHAGRGSAGVAVLLSLGCSPGQHFPSSGSVLSPLNRCGFMETAFLIIRIPEGPEGYPQNNGAGITDECNSGMVLLFLVG